MLIAPIKKFRRSRRPEGKAALPPVVGPLVLQSASYLFEELQLLLVFNRAVDISGFDVSSVTVKDGSYNYRVGTGSAVELVDPTQVQVSLTMGETWGTPGVTLTVTAENGLVAVGDGGTWAGATDLVLPFP